ncbi:Mn2+/Fe2+ NRAMP family transporter [Lactobacillus colini]|uniref:Mn2+/Fe2+ NRAMP family transporter n=1 Tax=Lactobacillus colini TaxID=1819254 RepID=A0ABS4MGU7_9LACO|nr:hypothetical protein [Lactobacillus colini]MBP2058547.1 Mn2+/Fe2+ NRAMP family transporter [Lactobacillus colini]
MKKENIFLTFISGFSIFLANFIYFFIKNKSITDALVNSFGITILALIVLILIAIFHQKK